ncbi:MAG: glycosyltransferase family A protein [Syntrophobacteraceae bacterium]
MNAVDGRVSVIIPVFNREFLAGQAIHSVLAQTYRNFEIVLIDDGSNDGTGAVLDGYAAGHPGTVTVLHQQNAGQAVARNNGINAATGTYIAFLDSDDTWLPQKLARQIPLFGKNTEFVYSGIFEVDRKGCVIREVRPEKNMRGCILNKAR